MDKPQQTPQTTFRIAKPLEIRTALSLVMVKLSASTRAAQVEQLITASPPEDFGQLWIAVDSEQLIAAVWGIIQEGNTAYVWPPRSVPGNYLEVRRTVLFRLLAALDEAQIAFAQTLLEVDDADAAELLIAAGFRREAELLYLVSLVRQTDIPPVDPNITFTSVAGADDPALRSIITQTYVGSQDCPSLNGRREIADVLHGYATTGEFDPGRWWIVRYQGQTAGVLLMTDHPAQDQWELLYMGLVPEMRGQGLGVKIVAHAQRQTRLANRSRLVLAVDAANVPARDMYEACGLLVWERRAVFLRWK